MSQTTWIAMAVAALFLVYVTAKGELRSYMAIFWGTPAAGSGAQTPGAAGASSPAATLNSSLHAATTALGGLPTLFDPQAQDFSGGVTGSGQVV